MWRQKISNKINATLNVINSNTYWKIVKSHLTKNSMYYIFVFVVFIFYVWNSTTRNSHILQPNQFVNLLDFNVQIIIIALPMLWVIVSGNIDLSVGRLYAFSGFLAVKAYQWSSGSVVASLAMVIAFGLFTGFAIGWLVGYAKIPAFIVTLGGMLLFSGLLLYFSKGQTTIPQGDGFTNEQFIRFSTAQIDVSVGGVWVIALLLFIVLAVFMIIVNLFGYINKKKYGLSVEKIYIFVLKQVLISALFLFVGVLIALSRNGLKAYMLYIVLIVGIFIFVTQNTKFGRAIYAIGGNRKAAALSGVNVARTTMYIFAVMGVVAAFSGLLFAGIQGSVAANDGNGKELSVISSVFVGGASVSGGIGTIIGTIIGTFIINFIISGLTIAESLPALINIIQAVILVLVVAYDTLSKRKIG